MAVDLNKLYSSKRTGITNPTGSGDPRSEFQRDFDRIIFSSSFRRLQNKTQVFPLPGSVFVHNRLTHSLEVASVGRSLGNLVGSIISKVYANELTPESAEFFKYSFYDVLAAACLCHDIGNPAFGHSGEDAIASYFAKNESGLKTLFTEDEWSDLINFEGNANAIRVLTQKQNGKSEGGLKLTYSTLAAIAKYPCQSSAKSKHFTHRKKFGFFQSEKQTFEEVASQTQMLRESKEPLIYRRHPFVWLVEAADDICYNIIDFEDAHRLGIVEHSACIELLLFLIDSIGLDDMTRVKNVLESIRDKNDKISYLRAKSINALTQKSVKIYETQLDDFLCGRAETPLFDQIKKETPALQQITRFSIDNIYNNRNVVEIENAGYNVMYELLSHFIPPAITQPDDRRQSDKKALKLLPTAFNYDSGSTYQRVMGIVDYVSGMTDNYATDLYKRIKGIEIGMKI